MPSQEMLDLFVQASYKSWQLSPIEFFNDVIDIKTVFGRRKLELYDCQIEVVEAYMADDREKLIILKARQMGFSTIFALLAYWQAIFRPHQVINFFADKEDDAKRLLAKAIDSHKWLPDWARDILPTLVVDNQLEAEFSNGSKITCFTATKKSGRGETANLVLLDEWAFLGDGTGDWAETAWSAVEPTVDLGGKFVGLSTANGVDNFYHHMWQSAINKPDWRRIFYGYDSIPGRDEGWWEKKRRGFAEDGQEWIVYQEYPRDAAEAFIKTGQTVFDVDILRALEPQMRPPTFRGSLDGHLYLHKETDGLLKIWHLPVTGCDYTIGADVAEGLEHGDFSDATVRLGTDYKQDGRVVLPRGTVVARWRGKIDADLFGDRLNDLGRFYRNALIGCEANNHGLSTIHRLQALQYPRLYRSYTQSQVYNKQTMRVGWYTNKATKPLIIDELARAIRTGSITFYDETLRAELLSFVRNPNGTLGRAGVRDDAVISTAISEEMLNHIYDIEYRVPEEVPYFSQKWFAELLDIKDNKPWI
jgi:hypothetical protein